MSTAIEVENLIVRRGKRAVLDGFSCAVPQGAVTGLLGPSGRASLACAIVSRPEVLILDEPTVGQDPVLRDELWGHFRRLAADGATVLVSSHVMDEANRCDRLLLIREGALIADDTPEAVKRSAGTDDLDQAFLTLIQRQAVAA